MAKVLGIGGVFFKSPDPARLRNWYAERLGFTLSDQDPSVPFSPQTMPPDSFTVWCPFEADTLYFEPSAKGFMLNLIVDQLEDALAQVSAGGAQIVGQIEAYDYGRFGWFIDPDGNKVELWEPAPSQTQ